MGLKKYVIFGTILLIAMAIGIYTFIGESYTLPLSAEWNIFKLPVAVWAIIPALILFLVTVFHMMFYGSVGHVRNKRLEKDSQKMTNSLKNALLGKIVDTEYKSEVFKLPGSIVPLLNIDPKRYADYRIYDDGILDILDIKRKVEDGEVVELDKYKLRNDNALVLKNMSNRLDSDKDYAKTVLKKCKNEELLQKAHLRLASYASIDEITKNDVKPTRKFFDTLVDRVGATENLIEMTNQQMVDYIKDLDYKSDDFVNLAKKLRKKVNPDKLMLMFERFSYEFPNDAGDSYLYVMFDLQLVDNARDFLENSAENEYAKYKYMLFLKDSGKSFDTELFI